MWEGSRRLRGGGEKQNNQTSGSEKSLEKNSRTAVVIKAVVKGMQDRKANEEILPFSEGNDRTTIKVVKERKKKKKRSPRGADGNAGTGKPLPKGKRPKPPIP